LVQTVPPVLVRQQVLHTWGAPGQQTCQQVDPAASTMGKLA